ncbi:MAG TPA: carboxypeptidase regulatory-like domain-containing protein [Polyangia bacterium]|nr:carboxypeptidase regulatory-like domain-containing protein [Polyangia bacterium]
MRTLPFVPTHRLALVLAPVLASVLTLGAGVAAAATTGSLIGEVRTEGTGDPIPGVLVTVSGPTLQGTQTEYTNFSGRYLITALPPGEYVVRFQVGSGEPTSPSVRARGERAGVVIHADQVTRVNAKLPLPEEPEPPAQATPPAEGPDKSPAPSSETPPAKPGAEALPPAGPPAATGNAPAASPPPPAASPPPPAASPPPPAASPSASPPAASPAAPTTPATSPTTPAAPIPPAAKPPASPAPLIRLTGRGANVDVGTGQQQTAVTDEVARRLPLGRTGFRTFEEVLPLAPATTTDAAGPVLHGASGLENSYIIDGFDTTDPILRRLGTRLSLSFIRETNILTGGFDVTYGRTLSGIVNVVTHTGSNELHGSAWFNAQPFQLAAPAVGPLGAPVARQSRLDHALDFGVDLGGPLQKDHVWFYVGFNPQFRTDRDTRLVRRRLDDERPAGGAPYAGDVDPNPRCPAWLRDRALCPGGAFLTRDVPEAARTYLTTTRLYSYIARLDFQSGENTHASFEYFASPETSAGVLGPSAPFGASTRGGRAYGSDVFGGGEGSYLAARTLQAHDVIGQLTSKLANRNLQVDLLFGYHYASSNTRPNAGVGGSDAASVDLRPGPLTRFENLAPCNPVASPAFDPCPIDRYRGGGYGLVDDESTARFQARLGFTAFFRLLGSHRLRFGGDVQDLRYRHRRAYTGGEYLTTLADGSLERRQFATVDPGTGQVDVQAGGVGTRTGSVGGSLYVHDVWDLAFLRGLAVHAGFRWEPETLRDLNGDGRLTTLANIAPRLGLVFDVQNRGIAKLFFTYGSYFESLPLALADRRLTDLSEVRQVTPNGTPFPPPQAGDVTSSRAVVSPVLRGQSTDETLLGAQVEVGWNIVVGASYVHRNLGRVVEDLSLDGRSFIIANPGEAIKDSTIESLTNQISDLRSRINSTGDPAEKARLTAQLNAVSRTISLSRGVATFPRARRDYDALVLTASKRFSNRLALLVSYVYSRTLGNYPGLYGGGLGPLAPNFSPEFDTRDQLTNRSGRLPEDRPHNLRVTGAYAIPVRGAEVSIGLTFQALSGTPISVLGGHPLLGDGGTFVLPRGTAGRTPTITSFDLHLGYSRRLTRHLGLDVRWDLFNLFNQRTPTTVDENYTYDVVAPLTNAQIADLATLRRSDGAPVTKNPNYGQPTSYQAPLSMRFGVRLSF